MLYARIASLAVHLPETVLTNADLAAIYPGWSESKISKKIGIESRRIASDDETALDLAEHACRRLFADSDVTPEEVAALIICTQSPDYTLPPNSTLLAQRLGLQPGVMAYDISHGCSGYVYLLSQAKAVIESGLVRNALVVTAETYSKYIGPDDKSVRTIFGDGATATMVKGVEAAQPLMEHFAFHTDGAGAKNLMVPRSGARKNQVNASTHEYALADGCRTLDNLYMNGPAIVEFTMREIPVLVDSAMKRLGLVFDDIDGVIFHQANGLMLESLRKICRIPAEKFLMHYAATGNTVSSTIPIVLKASLDAAQVTPGMRLLLAGFGVGYSSAVAVLQL